VKPNEMFSHWERVRDGLLHTIDLFGDDELLFVPNETSRTVGGTMLHIADAEDGWFRYAVKKELEEWPSQYTLENYPDRKSIKIALTEVHGRTEQFIDALEESDLARIIVAPWDEKFPIGWILWHVLEHEIHHRGELSLILGLLGREGLDV
jgi:uncharacterized damage-inducible protein DinB